jgi:hypothetical protein
MSRFGQGGIQSCSAAGAALARRAARAPGAPGGPGVISRPLTPSCSVYAQGALRADREGGGPSVSGLEAVLHVNRTHRGTTGSPGTQRARFPGGDRALATASGRHHGQAIRIDSFEVDDCGRPCHRPLCRAPPSGASRVPGLAAALWCWRYALGGLCPLVAVPASRRSGA